MVFFRFFPALIVGLVLCASTFAHQGPVVNEIFKGRWIIELEASPSLSYEGPQSSLSAAGNEQLTGLQATAPSALGMAKFNANAEHVKPYLRFLEGEREAFVRNATQALGRELEVLAVYRHVFNGLVLELSDEESAVVAKLRGVKNVHVDHIGQPTLNAGPTLIGARQLAETLPGLPDALGENTVVGIIDFGINWDHRAFSDHPSDSNGYVYSDRFDAGLGLCVDPEVKCNRKLVGIHDFTDEGTKGRDPHGHGSHVAAIAAGNEWLTGHGGVAPRAHVVSYKVCFSALPNGSGPGGCTSSAMLQALDQAVEDGVDVLNYSGAFGIGTNPWIEGIPMLNVRDAGILLTASAGNIGPSSWAVAAVPAGAPWVLGVGSSTHRVREGRRLAIPQVGVWPLVYGNGPPLQSLPAIHNATLLAASDVGNSPEGCNAYAAGSLAGAVVVVQRGGCNFRVKVDNAAQAGALAVIVVNDQPAWPFAMSDLAGTSIPAGMVEIADGLQILSALADQSPRTVNLPSIHNAFSNPMLEDRVSFFSSRGPEVHSPNLMKPNLVAPGEHILAAEASDQTSLGRRSGTSMSSPHVAGAVALLRQVHPEWTPAMLQSALETTAEVLPLTSAGQPATTIERGAGRVRVDRAAHVGLYLPVDREAFLAANPDQGGQTSDLNLAGIVFSDCIDSCQTTRTVRALTGSTWTVAVEGNLALTVQPTAFTLAAGEEQQLDILVEPGAIGIESLVDGRIRLLPNDPSLAEQALTVAAGFLTPITMVPGSIKVNATANRGRQLVNLPSLQPMDEAVFRTSSLVKPHRESLELFQDNTPHDPFSGGAGTHTIHFDVPADSLMLIAEIVASEAPDVDLFIGRSNGTPAPEDLVCARTVLGQFGGECAIANPEPGTWWIVVQNWEASSPGASDEIVLEHVVLSEQPADYSLVASGPGKHPGGTLSLPLYWDQPAIRRDEHWLGALAISSSPDQSGDVAVVPIRLHRAGPATIEPTALFNKQPLPVVIPPNSAHDQLFIDVPSSAQSLELTIQGDDGIEAFIHAMDLSTVADHAPGTPIPSGPILANGDGSAAGIELSLTFGNNLPPLPGRYYIRLNNPANEERMVEVEARIIETTRIDTRFGLWSPADRITFQGIEWQQGGPGFIIWYSFDDEGLPIFYIAIADIDPDTSIWRASLERVTGNNQRQTPEVVGEIALTSLSNDEMIFAWRLNGGHGSEIMINNIPQTCPQSENLPLSYTGHWFTSNAPAGGLTTLITADGQFYIRYYYDADGIGRWVFISATGASESLGDALEVRDFRGFCPNCPAFPMSYHENSIAAGSASLDFHDEDSAVEHLEFTTAPPLNHVIVLDRDLQKLSHRLDCP